MYGKNIYKGHRYVPIVLGQWNIAQPYEALTVVQYRGASFTSRRFVPVGIQITNEDYWVLTGNYNAQVELYRREVKALCVKMENNFKEVYQTIHNIQCLVNPNMTQAEINKVLRNCNNVKFLSGEYLVDPVAGYKLSSNQTVTLESDVVIKSKPNNTEHYKIINMDGLKNVTFRGGTIIGDRSVHTGSTGEWGMGIALYDSENILIEDVYVKDCWGDGVYLGASKSGTNKNITLNRVKTDNCRRQGFSIISAVGLVMNECQGLNINGTNPAAGIDFEPNYITQRLEQIYVKDFYSYNTVGAGVKVYDFSIPFIDITVENHRHVGTKNSGGFGFDVGGGNNASQEGIIRNVNPMYRNTRDGAFTFRNRPATKCRVEIYNPVIVDCNLSGGSSAKYNSAFVIFAEPTDVGNSSRLGNIHIYNPCVNGSYKCNRFIYAFDLRSSTVGLDKITIHNATDISGCLRKELTVYDCNNYNVRDEYNQFSYLFNATFTVTGNQFYTRYIMDTNATAHRGIAMGAGIPVGAIFEFANYSNNRTLTVSGVNIAGLPKVQDLEVQGQMLRLQKINDVSWIRL